ncbi:hypothetical protein DRN93_01695 [archaeon]|nr:MAG: hypothetical protein DRN93_01695 [archaeon]
MALIKKVNIFAAEYENEGELYEDFPHAKHVIKIETNPKTGLSTYHFVLYQSVHKETVKALAVEN